MLKKLITMEMLEQNRKILSKIYDEVRLINPYLQKLMIYNKNTGLEESDFHCYSFWQNNKVCDNCISMRAIIQNEIFFKLENKNDRIFMVTAIPVQDGNETYALELLKDVTNSLIVDNNEPIGSEILDLLSNISRLQITDSLTGVFNRRYIEDRLPLAIKNNISGKAPLSIIFADIDYFKKVNDTYGHIAGDYVLKEFASTLSSSFEKNSGWVARYGGEEFLLVLPDTDIEAIDDFAEKLRKKIENTKFIYNGVEISITSSFGAATLPSGKCTTAEKLIDVADKYLYTAKNSGRNKVISGILDL